MHLKKRLLRNAIIIVAISLFLVYLASNILPNLIGVPIAAYQSQQAFQLHDTTIDSTEAFREERIKLGPDVLEAVSYTEANIAIINATIIDGSGGDIKYNQTIVIEEGYFSSIGNTDEIDTSESVTIIDASGKTIIPGIVGVHNHLHIPGVPFMGETGTRLYLAAGVTTIQTCGAASPSEDIDLAQRIESGLALGPDIYTSGPYFTGPGGNPNMIIPRDAKHIRDTIKYWTDKGVSWFKVYRNTRPDDLKVILEETHKHNAKVTGHLCSITFEEAVNNGIDGIEHGLNSTSDFRKNKTIGLCDGSRDYIDDLNIDSAAVKNLQKHMIDNDVFLTSTLAIYEASIPNRAYVDERAIPYMSSNLLNQYKERRNDFDKRKDTLRNHRLRRFMSFDKQFYDMGGTLTAGVDAGRHVLPGIGDQRNFELLREAGFSVVDAVKVMSANGAKVLEDEAIGTIEVSKKANFIILNGNLENNPQVIKNVELVFKDGYGYIPRKLLKGLEGKFGRQ